MTGETQHTCKGGNACALDPARPHEHCICGDENCICHLPREYGVVFVGYKNDYRREGWEWAGIRTLAVKR